MTEPSRWERSLDLAVSPRMFLIFLIISLRRYLTNRLRQGSTKQFNIRAS
jgi:hypothetical protein